MPTDLGYNKQQTKRHQKQHQNKIGFLYNTTSLLFLAFLISLLTLYFDVPSRIIAKPAITTATTTVANSMNFEIPSQPKDGKTWKEVNKEHYEYVSPSLAA
jgi:hypothetical protein